ncbi:MAG: squalene synthase HpnC [Planctomycetaceae bacterium]|nr:squalene synthase HpnC [Planctomycetaceae bacterium]
MVSVVLAQLETYGPEHCRATTYEQADAYTQRLARSHYENFSVLSRFVPRRLRDDFAHVYAFCRWADDLGDETGDRARSLELLGWWRRELADCYAGRPRHPVFVALSQTIDRHEIPAGPFEDLIAAFEQDQRLTRYETWDQVLDYCTRSADPVGRLVLYLCDYRDEARQRLSDATCTALQLANFWQDVRRDIVERDRIYVPAEALGEQGLTHDDLVGHVRGEAGLSAAQHGAYRAVVRAMVERTRPLFATGRGLWPRLRGEVRTPIQLFTLGGETILRMIERSDYSTLDRRVSLSRGAKVWLMMRAVAGRVWHRGGRNGQADDAS